MNSNNLVLKWILPGLICTIHLCTGYSQIDEKKIFRKAQRYFLLEDYEQSVENYKMLADSFSDKFIYNYETALLYFYELDQKPKSIAYFEKAKKTMFNDSIPQLYLYIGQAYKANGDYDSAINAFKYYRAIDSNFIKVSVTRYIESCELGKQLLNKSIGNTKVENLGPEINTKFSEYTPVFLNNGKQMLFTSRRSKNVYDELIEALYVSDLHNDTFQEPVKIDSLDKYKDLVMDANEFQSVVGVSPNCNELLIYFDSYLFSSSYVGGKWTKPKPLPESINFNFMTTHASITADGKHIYFSSFEKKSAGNADIYHSEKQSDGSWGTDERLPSYINTRRKEDSPEITPDGKVLYFASNGLDGMGGFDIFKTEFKDNQWSKPENLGAPINSAGHDIYFRLHKGAEGTISSDRKGGYGGMDIYSVFIPEELSNPEFNNCIEASLGNYEVLFDATESIDPQGARILYQWDFGDKKIATGDRLSHFYKKPGSYKAVLNVIDSITGIIEKNQDEFEITIDNVDYLNIDCDSIIEIDREINFNAMLVSIKDGKISDIYWQPEIDTVKQGIKISHTYKSTGYYDIKIKVLYTKEGNMFESCITKKIKVLNHDDYKKYTSK